MSEYYGKVPKGYVENLKFRKYVLGHARSATDQKALRRACAEDVLFYVNTFCWTYDPRLSSPVIPLITYTYQDELILDILGAIRDQVPYLVQKSRDMGASWMFMLCCDYECTFKKDQKFFCMSRTAPLVDEPSDPDSLFWKVDFIHKNQPAFLRPHIERKLMSIVYNSTESVMNGSATTEAAGVGGRARALFVDELSRFQPIHAKLVKSGTADVSGCRLFCFTPDPKHGVQHPSYEFVEAWEKGWIRGKRLHWSIHPKKAVGLYRVDKDTRKVEMLDKSFVYPPDYKFQLDGRFEFHSVWFDKERLHRGNDREISEQLDIDWAGSGHTVFDPVMIRAYRNENCVNPYVEGDLTYEANGVPKEFVVFGGGPMKLWMKVDQLGRPPIAQYVTGIDIAMGSGATPSCLSVGRCDTGEKVLEFVTARMKPDEFALKCVAIARWLSSPGKQTLLCWEASGIANSFRDEIARCAYAPLYYYENSLRYTRPGVEQNPGWPPKLNQMLLEHYRTGLASGDFVNRSEAALEEALLWVYTPKGVECRRHVQAAKDDPSGASSNHGDRVIADAQCYRMMGEYPGQRARPEHAEEKMSDLEREIWKSVNDRRSKLDRGLYEYRGPLYAKEFGYG